MAVGDQELNHSNKCRSLVALLERMGVGDPGHQPDREHDDILLAIGKRVLRPRQRTLQQSGVAQEMRLAGNRYGSSVDFDDYLDGQP